MIKVLNLYAGVGGNRKLWGGLSDGVQVVAVESDPKIARVYQDLFPEDTVIVGDAHSYLEKSFREFDFIWSSRPCQTHSKMCLATRHKSKKIPDMGLYGEVIFLDAYFDGEWVVENVEPFYKPLITPNQIVGRHYFWSSFEFSVMDVKRPDNFINLSNTLGKEKLQAWLGIHYEGNVYYGNNHCPAQILRNCVHPIIAKDIFNQAPLRRQQ